MIYVSDEYEAESIASTEYSFDSDEHPELDLLTTTHSEYTDIRRDPFTPVSLVGGRVSPSEAGTEVTGTGTVTGIASDTGAGASPSLTAKSNSRTRDENSNDIEDKEIINDDSGDEGYANALASSNAGYINGDFDSELNALDPTCIVISTSTKAHAGVARYKDFIRCLPVHLSKMILGMLDQVTLFNCVCVSQAWRILTEEVHVEYFVNQQLWEEVMLMQVSTHTLY